MCCPTCCFLAGACYFAGDENPDNACLVCDPNGSGGALDWSERTGSCADTTACTTNEHCQDGECVSDPEPLGTACPDEDPCLAVPTCDGLGQCSGPPVDCSSLDTPCAVGVCNSTSGECEAEALVEQAGAVCGAAPSCQSTSGDATLFTGDLCNDAGECVLGALQACAPYVACDSGGSACATSCDSGADCTVDASCEDGVCRGHEALGAACLTDAICESGHCADGVCCDSACDGSCTSCALGATSGICGAVPAGDDPRDDCTSAGECGFDGSCDGSGGCAWVSAGTACGADACGIFNTLDRGTCDGTGACVVAPAESCAPGICVHAACVNACSSDGDCASGAWCDNEQGECSDANRRPVAVLTSLERAVSNVAIPLDGTDSYDPDGDPLTYRFTQVLGPRAELDGGGDLPGAAATAATVGKTTLLVFELVVSDGELESEPAFHSIEIVVPDTGGCLGCQSTSGDAAATLLALALLMARTRGRPPKAHSR